MFDRSTIVSVGDEQRGEAEGSGATVVFKSFLKYLDSKYLYLVKSSWTLKTAAGQNHFNLK